MANEKFKINGVVSEVVPIIGTTGDILKKTVSGVEWGALVKATRTQDGLLNKEDFKKLADIEVGAQVNAVTSVNGQTGEVITPNTTYDVATTSENGLMSSTDKSKLDELIYTRAMTDAAYEALSQAEKDRLDVWYGIYEG